MSPSALSITSNIGTPSSVKSCGWTLEQRSDMFPAHIDDALITSQYEPAVTDEAIEKNQSDCQQWLEQADLTSPWSTTLPNKKNSLNRSKVTSVKVTLFKPTPKT